MAPCTRANPLECPHTCGSMKVSIPIDVSYESTVKGTTKLPLTVPLKVSYTSSVKSPTRVPSKTRKGKQCRRRNLTKGFRGC